MTSIEAAQYTQYIPSPLARHIYSILVPYRTPDVALEDVVKVASNLAFAAKHRYGYDIDPERVSIPISTLENENGTSLAVVVHHNNRETSVLVAFKTEEASKVIRKLSRATKAVNVEYIDRAIGAQNLKREEAGMSEQDQRKGKKRGAGEEKDEEGLTKKKAIQVD